MELEEGVGKSSQKPAMEGTGRVRAKERRRGERNLQKWCIQIENPYSNLRPDEWNWNNTLLLIETILFKVNNDNLTAKSYSTTSVAMCPHLSTILSTILSACFLIFKIFIYVPGGSDSKETAYNAGDLSSIPGSERSPGRRHGNPLQYSCLENPMDRGAWRAAVHGSQSRTRLSE